MDLRNTDCTETWLDSSRNRISLPGVSQPDRRIRKTESIGSDSDAFALFRAFRL